MSDFQAIADRVEIEALRGEFTDAVMMRDRARLASLFTPDGALRMPSIPAEMVGREQIRTGRRLSGLT
ncbi:MAG: nuclear transport factor 2 family protein [Streptosporangiaceae bacterium]|jgi:ketosteroid isomerase-like protein